MKYVALLVLLLSAVGFVIWYKTVPLSIEEITPLVEILKKQRIELRNKQLAEMSDDSGPDVEFEKEKKELIQQRKTTVSIINTLTRKRSAISEASSYQQKIEFLEKELSKLEETKDDLLKEKREAMQRLEDLERRKKAHDRENYSLNTRQRDISTSRLNKFSFAKYRKEKDIAERELRKIEKIIPGISQQIQQCEKELETAKKSFEAVAQYQEEADQVGEDLKNFMRELVDIDNRIRQLEDKLKNISLNSKKNYSKSKTGEYLALKEKIKKESNPEILEKISFVDAHIMLSVLHEDTYYWRKTLLDAASEKDVTTYGELMIKVSTKDGDLRYFLNRKEYFRMFTSQMRAIGLSCAKFDREIMLEYDDLDTVLYAYDTMKKAYREKKSFVHKLFESKK